MKMQTLVAAAAALTVFSGADSLAGTPRCENAGMVVRETKILRYEGPPGTVGPGNTYFGESTAGIGDVDGDGVNDLAVGAFNDSASGLHASGAVWILFLNADGSARERQKIGHNTGGLIGPLDADDQFGICVSRLGDFDGDGIPDLIVGANGDGDGGSGRGAIYLLFLNRDGTVKHEQKISSTQGGFDGDLYLSAAFGSDVAPIGDLDRDGVTEIAVGHPWNRPTGESAGALWILFMNPDGTVKASQEISESHGNFINPPRAGARFGSSVAGIGDLDNDGMPDVAVGAVGDHDGGNYRGALWIVFLNADGTVKDHQKISSLQGGFEGPLSNGDKFGYSVDCVGDLDQDGIVDLVVGAWAASGDTKGAAWIVFLNNDGTVKSQRRITGGESGFNGKLNTGFFFGSDVALLGDLDSDSQIEIAVGARGYGYDHSVYGAVWILTLDDCGNEPSITEQPRSVLLPPGGGHAQLDVSAAGEPPLDFQWRKRGVNLAESRNISGAQTPTLTIHASNDEIDSYDCVVTNEWGQSVSEPAVIAIRQIECPGDADANGIVNFEDITKVISHWLQSCP